MNKEQMDEFAISRAAVENVAARVVERKKRLSPTEQDKRITVQDVIHERANLENTVRGLKDYAGLRHEHGFRSEEIVGTFGGRYVNLSHDIRTPENQEPSWSGDVDIYRGRIDSDDLDAQTAEKVWSAVLKKVSNFQDAKKQIENTEEAEVAEMRKLKREDDRPSINNIISEFLS